MALTIDGEAHNMLLICSGLSTAGALKDNVAYPRIAEDFRESFARLESFPCEIFLAPHASMFGLQSKRVLGTPEAFLDTVGCAAFIRRQKQAFEAALAGED